MKEFSQQYFNLVSVKPFDGIDLFDYEEIFGMCDNGFAIMAKCNGLEIIGVGKSDEGERVVVKADNSTEDYDSFLKSFKDNLNIPQYSEVMC
jgi:hypothetical protein